MTRARDDLQRHYLHLDDLWQSDYFHGSPVYDSLARAEDYGDRLLEGLLRHTSLQGKRVLEIGCGTGRYTRPLTELVRELVALDIYPRQVEVARDRCPDLNTVRFLIGDAASMPLADGSVDITFEAYVVSVMTTPEMRDAAFAEMVRVVRPGGEIWITWGIGGDLVDPGGQLAPSRLRSLIQDAMRRYGLVQIDEVIAEARFPSLEEARATLTHFWGDGATAWLDEHDSPVLSQRMILMRRRV